MSQLTPKPFWPTRILVSSEASEDPITKRVLARMGGFAAVTEIERASDPLSGSSSADGVSQGKRTLVLQRYLGDWLEHCPAGTSSHVCCNLMTVNPGEGCPLDCTYCYLQSYLKNNPSNKIYTNVADMFAAIESRLSAEPQRFFRVGTGEVVDSLVWDELTDFSCDIVPFFGRQSNATLEFRTKTACVDNLLALRKEHNGNTVISWSVNAPSICQDEEKGTASLDNRISAAAQCIEAGYRVGFHFDPLVYFEGCEDEYRDTVARIFRVIDKDRVAWVSLGTLRYKREMHEIMKERFPDSSIPYGEQRFSPDKKLRYPQPIRMHLQRLVWNELKRYSPSIALYMCMENSAAWRSISGMMPGVNSNLVEIASRKGPKNSSVLGGLSTEMGMQA